MDRLEVVLSSSYLDMIEVKNITKSYGNIKALNGVSFRVETGEIVGLLGPNGAGKTTTLNIITGVLLPDQGEVTVEDRSMGSYPREIKQMIGYLPEENPLYDNMLVEEAMRFAAELKGLTPVQFGDQIGRIVRSTGIKEIYYRPISTLSKGLRQRVGLAQALIGDPKVLVLDEPTEGLDPNQRQEIRNLITSLGKDRTIILSTHVMQEVEAICERVVIVNKGELVTSSTVAAITQLKEGSIEIEFGLKGDVNIVLSALGSAFSINKTESGSFLVQVDTPREDEFYRLLNKHTNDMVYVTSLTPRRANLEEVFRRLTQ